ncbi:MAG TPA: hypothetical protein VJV23_07310 [Candidatus Polarisedimenticolia bacterium]|nr:hypothetical protein [Candidatus Polarisedimenticolia bacterium]
MTRKRAFLAAGAAALISGAAVMAGAGVLVHAPVEESTETSAAAQASGGLQLNATGGYHFTIPVDFNGGIFGTTTDILNRVTFSAQRTAEGEVGGWFMYEQEADGQVFRLGGPVTCFKRYDTPVLVRFPGIPAQTQNRAKWGGRIEVTNDPSLEGLYAWFNSIDNGEGASGYSDISSLLGLGNEAANEAFCNSPNPPNPNFGPFAIGGGNIQVR